MTDTLLPFMFNNNSNYANTNNGYRGSSCNLSSQSSQPTNKQSQISNNNMIESPMIKRKKLLKSLDQSFFIRLLQVEEQISKKNLTKEMINEVVNLYAKCVEYYDSIQDPIKIYFLEKIQITLSSMESLRVIYSSDENSAKKPNINSSNTKNSDYMQTPSQAQNKKNSKNNLISKNTINKFQTENSLNTNQKSQSSSQSSYNNLSSNKHKNHTITNKTTPFISKRESIKVSEFSSTSSSSSSQNTPILTNNLANNSAKSQQTYKSSISNKTHYFKSPVPFDENISKQLSSKKNSIGNNISPNSALALNQSLQKSLSSIQSSFMKDSPNYQDKQMSDERSQQKTNQSNVVIESFAEDESISYSRLRFTLNPNTILQCDLNISDLNAENSLTNTSHNSRIEMNVKNIVGEKNYRSNYCDKNKLIEHGKALFNKNLQRQSSNLMSICNQFENGNIQNTINTETNVSQFTIQQISQNENTTPLLHQSKSSSDIERTILGVRKNQFNNQTTNNSQQVTNNYPLHKQKSLNIDYNNFKENNEKENKGNLKQLLKENKENCQSIDKQQSQSVTNSHTKLSQQKPATSLSSIAEYSIQQKKVERAKRFSMFITMQNQKKQSVIKQDFNKILNRFEQDAQQKDQIVKSDIDNQMEMIKQRLQSRKSKNIQERVIKDIQTRQETIKELFKENIINGSQTSRF